MDKRIPQALRTWFFIHFLVDIFFAIPLLFFPAWSLRLLGFMIIEPLTTRLVGAALLAIGGISLLSYRQGKERFDVLLTLKIIWSGRSACSCLWYSGPFCFFFGSMDLLQNSIT